MARNSKAGKQLHVISAGHAVFALTMIVLGIIGLVKGDFTPTWGGVYKSFPAQTALAYLCAVISLVSGIGMLWQTTALFASRMLLIYLWLWLLVFRVSYIFMHPIAPEAWWAFGDTAVMLAATWILYIWFADEQHTHFRFATGDTSLRIARILYGFALIPFGAAHFIFLKRSLEVIPGWMPWHLFWAYATGCFFIAAGIAILTGIYARLAAALSVLMMVLFTVIVWIPIILAHPGAFDWLEFYDSCALMAGGWVVADSYRRIPWLSVVKY